MDSALACTGTNETHTGLWCRNLKERDHFEVLVLYDRIILNLFSEKYDGTTWTARIWLRIGKSGIIVNTVMNLIGHECESDFLSRGENSSFSRNVSNGGSQSVSQSVGQSIRQSVRQSVFQ